MKQPQGESPSVWLWQEIERRFGVEAATSLRAGYNAQQRLIERRARLTRFQDDISSMQELITAAEKQGDYKAARRYRRQLEHRQSTLAMEEQAEQTSDASMTIQPLNFIPGQA